jgi:hypothetical protein
VNGIKANEERTISTRNTWYVAQLGRLVRRAG